MKSALLICSIFLCQCSCRYGKSSAGREDQKDYPQVLTGAYYSDTIPLDDGNLGILKLVFDTLNNRVIEEYAVSVFPNKTHFDSIVSSHTSFYKWIKSNEMLFKISGVDMRGLKYICDYNCVVEYDSVRCLLVINQEGYYPFYQSKVYYRKQ